MIYPLGPVKPWVSKAAYHFGPKHGIKVIGGVAARTTVSDHPSGHALDYMVRDKARGDALVADLIANAKGAGVTYIIWYRRIWQNGTWRAYTLSNPHTDHVHVSFQRNPPSGALTGGTTATTGPTATPASVGVGIPSGGLEKVAGFLVESRTWLRIAWFVIGFALVIYALVGWSTVKEGVSKVVKT
jgi:hypothetical protein